MQREYYMRWTVDASDSWLQPLLSDSHEAEVNTQNKYLTDLNDDILFEIMLYLDIKDCLALVCTDARFLPAFEMFAQHELKVVSYTDLRNLSEWQKQQFFAFAGEYIEEYQLQVYYIDKWCFKSCCLYLTMYCPNLKTLEVSSLCHRGADDLNKLLAKMQNLKTFELYACSIRDECSAAISNLAQLEELSLSYCDYITGKL